MNDRLRQAHASLNVASRLGKAEKILRLLGPLKFGERSFRVLEVGTGAGVIAHYFSQRLGERGMVDAVDVRDQRVVCDGYRFHLTTGTALPFDAGTFDIVVSNHVIEHVGPLDEQVRHVRELSRVLRPDGVGYLAVPSRWQVVEPHYGVAFLGWLPPSWRSRYLRARGRGDIYDCEPLSMGVLESFFDLAGVQHRNLLVEAVHAMNQGGSPSLPIRLVSRLPAGVLRTAQRLSPTHIYLFAHSRDMLGRGACS